MLLLPSEEGVGAVDIDAVEPLRHDAVHITIGRAEDHPLPRGMPIPYRKIPRPLRILFAEPRGLLGGVGPLRAPIRSISLGLTDRQVGQQHARTAVGASLHARDFLGCPLALKAAVGGGAVVDHQQVVRRSRYALGLKRAEPVT